MGFIIIALVIVLLTLAGSLFLLVDGQGIGGVGVVALGAIILVAVWLFASYNGVPSGHLGLVYNVNGDLQPGVLGPGAHWIAPWNSVADVSTQTQHAEFDRLPAFSQESQDIFGDIQINYHINQNDVVPLYRNTGSNWFDTFVPGTVLQDFKEEITKYKSTDIAPNRATIAQEVQKNLTTDLGQHSIKVDNVYVKNIDYSAQFRQAVEAKQAASQRAAQANFEADQLRNQAKGDRDAARIRANGVAQANERLRRSISPELVSYQRALALSSLSKQAKVIVIPPSTYLGSGVLSGQ